MPSGQSRRLRRCYRRQESSTISQNFCGACSNIQWRVPGIIAVLRSVTCAASARSTCGSAPLVSAPPMNSVGVLIASASALVNGCALSPDLADQGEGVVAQVLLRRRRQPRPGARAFDRVQENLQRRRRYRRSRSSRRRPRSALPSGEGPGRQRGSSDRIELAAGLGQDQPAQQIRPALRDAERRCVRRANGPSGRPAWLYLLDEGDHVVDMLRDRIGRRRCRPNARERNAAA